MRQFVKFLALFMLVMMWNVSGLAAAEIKIGFVNDQLVLAEVAKMLKIEESLSKEFKDKENELRKEKTAIQQMVKEFSKNSAVMSESKKNQMRDDIQKRMQEFELDDRRFKVNVQKRQNEELSKAEKLIIDAVEEVAKKENFKLIVSRGTLFADKSIDVTDKVIAAVKKQKK